ncbi:MAG TPA: hypothetical protein VLZ81_05985, partial [Blastocatellia bacterium]|nr:hypothetical protein [Blastocatellia bacterium]
QTAPEARDFRLSEETGDGAMETEQMGLPGNWQRAEWFAERLLLIAKQMDEDSEATPPPGSPT